MIDRIVTKDILEYLNHFPSVTFLGPRQVGKTTLAKHIAKVYGKKKVHYFDLENENDLFVLKNNAFNFLETLKDDLVILDEVQVYPQILSTLRSVIDNNRIAGRFILLGSADLSMVKGVSESLAGRVAYREITPIHLLEALNYGIEMSTHWFKGGFPEPLLMKSDKIRNVWTESFINTYIFRDLNQFFGINLNGETTHKLWNMLAHLHSQIENKESIGRSLGLTGTTVKKYIDYMEGAYLIRRLPPWYTNNGKRLTKSPKIYVRTTGVLHHLLNISDYSTLQTHPALGASWEGYVVEQVFANLPDNTQMYYYRTHHGAEVDIVLVRGGTPIATLEIKYSDAPKLSKGLYECISDLDTKLNYILTPSSRTFPISENIEVLSLECFLRDKLGTL